MVTAFNHHSTKLSVKITVWWFFFSLIFPWCKEGDSTLGFRGILESWSIESFSGPVSRRTDETRLNIANHSWKICTCADFLLHCCCPGISPFLGDWPQSQMCRHSKMHEHAHTVYVCQLQGYLKNFWKNIWKANCIIIVMHNFPKIMFFFYFPRYMC